MSSSRQDHRRFSHLFWLTLCALTTAIIAPLIPLGIRAHQQRAVARAFDQSGILVRNRELAPEWVIRAAQYVNDDARDWLSEVTAIEHFAGEIDDSQLRLLRGLTSLEELRIYGESLTDARMVHLRGLSGLKRLELTNVSLTDRGISQLAGLHSLEELDIGGTGISDEGLRSLSGLQSLQRLNLESTLITEAGLRHLESLPNLRAVQCDETPIYLELCEALSRGDVDWIKAAITRTPKLICSVDYHDYTLLHLAVEQMNFSPEIVRTFIDAGMDLEATTAAGYGHTVLEHAAILSRFPQDDVDSRVHFLLDYGANYTMLAAIGRDDLARVRELASGSFPLNEQRSHIEDAISLGRATVVDILIEKWKFNLDQRDVAGFPFVCRATEYPEVLIVLLERGANPDLTVERDHFCCFSFASTEIVEGGTALHEAAAKGYSTSAELLLVRGANINARDSLGQTPLMQAVAHGRIAVLQVLVLHGADPTICDAHGETAITLAQEHAESSPLFWKSLIEFLQTRGKSELAALQ